MDIIRIRELLNSGKSIFDIEMRVAYYARVSTDKDEQSGSLTNQVGYYEDLIGKNPAWSFAGGYVDEGISGTGTAQRAGFLRMIGDAGAGRIDFIITKEISRFSRNTLDSIGYTRKLLEWGVGVLFQSDGINTFLPDAELRLTIMSGIAQDEVRKLSERVSFGLHRAMENGRVLGLPPIGYKKKDGALEIDPDQAELVRRAFDLYARGDTGIRKLAAKLGISYHTLHAMLTNPKYKGYYCGNKTKRADFRSKRSVRLDQEEWVLKRDERIPALVDEATWDRVNALLERRGRLMKGNQACFNRYPYSGKVICAVHKAAFHRQLRQTKAGEKEVWSCREYRKHGREKGCGCATLSTGEINAVMTRVVRTLLSDTGPLTGRLMEIYEKALRDESLPARLKEAKNVCRELKEKQNRLLDLALDGAVDKDAFGAKNAELSQRLRNAENTLVELERSAAGEKSRKARLEDLKKRAQTLLNAPVLDEKLCASILDKILVSGTKDQVKLEVYLSSGKEFCAGLDTQKKCILLFERGISQAQVSRLEKSALKHMQKYI